jgi:hypothetical protein
MRARERESERTEYRGESADTVANLFTRRASINIGNNNAIREEVCRVWCEQKFTGKKILKNT